MINIYSLIVYLYLDFKSLIFSLKWKTPSNLYKDKLHVWSITVTYIYKLNNKIGDKSMHHVFFYKADRHDGQLLHNLLANQRWDLMATGHWAEVSFHSWHSPGTTWYIFYFICLECGLNSSEWSDKWNHDVIAWATGWRQQCTTLHVKLDKNTKNIKWLTA